MKRICTLLLALAMTLGLAACGTPAASPSPSPSPSASTEPTPSQPADEPVELVIFAAASMTETLQQVAELYQTVAPNVTLVFNFDSSGVLKTQIQEGADCDAFISAGQKQMNQLDSTADVEVNTEGLDLVLQGSRRNLLENRVTLCVAEGNPAGLESYDDLVKALTDGTVLLAMGNSDVPVGQYTQKILTYYELDEAALANAGAITYGSNVKEVTTQVTEGSVDCGIIYCTDAFSAGLTPVAYATAEMCGQVVYPGAVINTSTSQAEAQAFLDYLSTPEAMAIFEHVGFVAA